MFGLILARLSLIKVIRFRISYTTAAHAVSFFWGVSAQPRLSWPFYSGQLSLAQLRSDHTRRETRGRGTKRFSKDGRAAQRRRMWSRVKDEIARLLNAAVTSVCVKEPAVSIAWVAVGCVVTVASCSANLCRPVFVNKQFCFQFFSPQIFVRVSFLQAVVVEAENFFFSFFPHNMHSLMFQTQFQQENNFALCLRTLPFFRPT